MVEDTHYACTFVVSYKPGMRGRGDTLAEEHLRQWSEGYRGFLIQSSLDDPDTAVYTTFWDSDRSMFMSLEEVDVFLLAMTEIIRKCIRMHLSKVNDHWLHLEPG
jgi:hypothetical protein